MTVGWWWCKERFPGCQDDPIRKSIFLNTFFFGKLGYDISSVIKGGVFLHSAYLVSGQGLSESNIFVFARVAIWLHTMTRPFIWVADWDLTLEELGEMEVLRSSQCLLAPMVTRFLTILSLTDLSAICSQKVVCQWMP